MKRGMVLGALLAGAIAAPAHPQDASDALPPAPGNLAAPDAAQVCTACHGAAIVRSQGMSRERWSATLDEMVARHGMPAPDTADRQALLDYLAATFPPRARGRPNPFAGRP